jgi:hypothetical protein
MKRYEALPERHMVHVCQRKGCPYYGTAGRAICSDTGHQAAVPFVPEQRLEGAVEALEEIVDDLSVPNHPAPWAAHALQVATMALEQFGVGHADS